MRISLDFRKKLEENAAIYFEKAKKAKKKVEGAKKILDSSLSKLEELKKKRLNEMFVYEEQKNKSKTKIEKKWYHKFRWFFTSDGFLVVGGRDATTNDIIIKKHTDNEDIVCHTLLPGSPFFVIKKNSNPGKEISRFSIQQAIDATFMFSRAFKQGLYSTEVYYVKPEQVVKDLSLPKGSFLIKGKKNFVKPDQKLAICIYDGLPMCAPLDAITPKTNKFVELVKGETKKSDLAKLIQKRIGGEIDDIIQALPPAELNIKEEKKSMSKRESNKSREKSYQR